MPEWLKGADCKSAGFGLRWFETSSLHQLFSCGLDWMPSKEITMTNLKQAPNPAYERRVLQAAVLIFACVPVLGGLAGVISGLGVVQATSPDLVSSDSHVRYLSGLLLGIGLAFWSLVPRIERAGSVFSALTFLVAVGGLARLASVAASGLPSRIMLSALVMELAITPLLCVWQHKLERRWA
jgi:Domain of unknown function (DUF4345)